MEPTVIESIDIMDERGPETTALFSEPSATPSTTGTSDHNGPLVKARRKPMPRKGHTKSRRGCLNCKRRRVKCPETRPRCGHCIRLNLYCQYPGPRSSSVVSSMDASMGTPSKTLSSTPTQLSMDDLRFFHHFLFTAYPPLPIDGDVIWREVARLSHSFDFLVHAMLGLAASHLTLCHDSTANYSSHALVHRVQAMNSLNQALSCPCSSKAEGDARFATLLVLAFQSSYMPDGMLDFLHMIRGCVVISETAMICFEDSAFRIFSTGKHQRRVREMSEFVGHSDIMWFRDVAWYREFVRECLESVRALAPMCQTGFEATYFGILESILDKAKITPVEGFAELCDGYAILNGVIHDDFRHFTDPANHTAQILLVHFFLIEHEIGSLALRPIIQAFLFRSAVTAAWIRDVAARLPPAYTCYLAWPLEYEQSGKMRETAERCSPSGLVT